MKKTIKLIPAIVMLLVSAILVSTSTYAWFSMNNRVTVTGMVITTKVNNNLLIAETNAEANYGIALHQVKTGVLEPVSTINGVSYFYTNTNNVVASGDAKTDTYVAYDRSTDGGKNAFDGNYGFPSNDNDEDCVGYIDYSFYLKGTNSDSVARKIYMDTCNLLYDGAELTEKAYRVAVFAKVSAAATTTSDEVDAGNLKAILAPASAAYFTAGKAVSATNAAPSTAVTNLGSRAVIAEVASGATVYYKVTVRLWLEGEDTTCKNDTFATLTKDWTLDLAFTLGDSGASDANAVNVIGSAAVASLSGDGATRTAALTVAGETAASYAWKNIDGSAAGGTNNAASYTAEAAGTFYCEITTAKGTVYRTPSFTYTPAP